MASKLLFRYEWMVEIQGQQSLHSLPQKPRLVRIIWKRRKSSGVFGIVERKKHQPEFPPGEE